MKVFYSVVPESFEIDSYSLNTFTREPPLRVFC